MRQRPDQRIEPVGRAARRESVEREVAHLVFQRREDAPERLTRALLDELGPPQAQEGGALSWSSGLTIRLHAVNAGVLAEMGGSPSWGELGLPDIFTGMIKCSGTHTDSKPASSATLAISPQRLGAAMIIVPIATIEGPPDSSVEGHSRSATAGVAQPD